MNVTLFSFIILAALMTLPTYAWLLSWVIPDKWLDAYEGRGDRTMDIVASLFSLYGMGFITYVILHSYLTNGWVHLSAVELNEAEAELIVLSIVLITLIVHLSFQIKVFRRYRK